MPKMRSRLSMSSIEEVLRPLEEMDEEQTHGGADILAGRCRSPGFQLGRGQIGRQLKAQTPARPDILILTVPCRLKLSFVVLTPGLLPIRPQ